MKKNDLPPIASRKEVETFINLFMKTTSETFCEVVRATIDKSCDMGYIYLSDQKGSYNLYEFRNEKDHTTFVVDFDIDGCLLGIEVFCASERMPKWILDKAEDITSELISMEDYLEEQEKYRKESMS